MSNKLVSGETKTISSSGIKETSFNNLDDFKAGLEEKEDIANEGLKAKLEMTEIKDKTKEDLIKTIQKGKERTAILKSPEVILPIALGCILIFLVVFVYICNLISEKTKSGKDIIQSSDTGTGCLKQSGDCFTSIKS